MVEFPQSLHLILLRPLQHIPPRSLQLISHLQPSTVVRHVCVWFHIIIPHNTVLILETFHRLCCICVKIMVRCSVIHHM